MIGDFYREGTIDTQGTIEVNDHDFGSMGSGTAIPHGVYDVGRNEGFVHLNVSHDTSELACDSLAAWWEGHGRAAYPGAVKLLVLCDGGGSNSASRYVFKEELQKLADESDLRITVSHYPPGTSKWNKIEHRMFCHITANWRAVPLESREIIVELISHTTTEKGLTIQAELDTNTYKKGRVVTKQEFAALALTREVFHGEWNYTLAPRNKR